MSHYSSQRGANMNTAASRVVGLKIVILTLVTLLMVFIAGLLALSFGWRFLLINGYVKGMIVELEYDTLKAETTEDRVYSLLSGYHKGYGPNRVLTPVS